MPPGFSRLHGWRMMKTMPNDASIRSIDQLRILVVDDHLINRELLSTGLSRTVGRIDTAENGPDAVDLCSRHDYDAILMDLHMPQMDGRTAARLIRELDTPSARARMVALTADTRPAQRARLLKEDFDEYLNKPVSIAGLTAALRQLFRLPGPAGAMLRPDGPDRLIDPGSALAATGDDAGLSHRLAAMFMDELEEKLPLLDDMLYRGDRHAAAGLLHQWAGSSGYAGAMRLSKACQRLHQPLVSEDDESLTGIRYLHFLRIAHATRQALRHSLARVA